jgi:UDP-N-acetylmuramate dehydrogenase
VVREGKVASAYFLEQVGAKGMFAGGIRVADYHANLLYNTGDGTAAQVRHLIMMLKLLVLEHFGIHLDEEVQYI